MTTQWGGASSKANGTMCQQGWASSKANGTMCQKVFKHEAKLTEQCAKKDSSIKQS
jgi:hypothetical protein